MSPYNYCAWNPVKLVDEEGESPRPPFWIRAAFSKQLRQAVSYKLKHGGKLSVWECSVFATCHILIIFEYYFNVFYVVYSILKTSISPNIAQSVPCTIRERYHVIGTVVAKRD